MINASEKNCIRENINITRNELLEMERQLRRMDITTVNPIDYLDNLADYAQLAKNRMEKIHTIIADNSMRHNTIEQMKNK